MLQSLSAATLLAAWDRAAAVPPSLRAATILAAAWQGRTPDDWAHRPLGERDHALLLLRESLFGTTLETVATCPACGERLEARFRTQDIASEYAASEAFAREINGHTIHFRPPTQFDLECALETGDPRATLVARCVHDADAFDAGVIAEVVTAMSACDPQADVHVALQCPVCQSVHDLPFDIATYFWADLTDWATQLLTDVHSLARAYGWHEHDILAMSAFRRRMYLGLLGA